MIRSAIAEAQYSLGCRISRGCERAHRRKVRIAQAVVEKSVLLEMGYVISNSLLRTLQYLGLYNCTLHVIGGLSQDAEISYQPYQRRGKTDRNLLIGDPLKDRPLCLDITPLEGSAHSNKSAVPSFETARDHDRVVPRLKVGPAPLGIRLLRPYLRCRTVLVTSDPCGSQDRHNAEHCLADRGPCRRPCGYLGTTHA